MIFDGQRFQEIREKRLLSRSALAKKLGVARPQISRWEHGKCVPRIDTVKRICKVLGVEPQELVQVETVEAAS